MLTPGLNKYHIITKNFFIFQKLKPFGCKMLSFQSKRFSIKRRSSLCEEWKMMIVYNVGNEDNHHITKEPSMFCHILHTPDSLQALLLSTVNLGQAT